jgi:hypothetical protein
MRMTGRWRSLVLAAAAALALASCGPSTTPATTIQVVNQSPRTVTIQWNSPGIVGPIGASTEAEDIDGCARDDHAVLTSDHGLAIRSYAASLPVEVPQSGAVVSLYYLVRPDGQIEPTTADVADAIPTADPAASSPSVCPTPSGTK